MSGLPEVTVAGTLTADPDLRFTPNGVAVANFTVAANDRRLDSTTNRWVDGDATFLRCSIWRQAAENVAESLHRGQRVLVTGRLKQRSYETAEGERRTVMELDVVDVGPSLKWATARVTKATRANGGAGASPTGEAAGDRGGRSDDPWTRAAEPAATAPADDKPPF